MISEDELTDQAGTYLAENLISLTDYLSEKAKAHIVLVMSSFAMRIASDVIEELRREIPDQGKSP